MKHPDIIRVRLVASKSYQNTLFGFVAGMVVLGGIYCLIKYVGLQPVKLGIIASTFDVQDGKTSIYLSTPDLRYGMLTYAFLAYGVVGVSWLAWQRWKMTGQLRANASLVGHHSAQIERLAAELQGLKNEIDSVRRGTPAYPDPASPDRVVVRKNYFGGGLTPPATPVYDAGNSELQTAGLAPPPGP